jgi:hypothetical protein
MTQCHRIVDGQVTFIVTLDHFPHESELCVHSCFRFFPGRSVGEKITPSVLPWFARQRIAELTNEPLP